MKLTTVCVLFLLHSSLLVLLSMEVFAQENPDIVYLKNGSIIKGTIIELIPEKSLRIKTSDGRQYFFTMSEVATITMASVSTAAIKAPSMEKSPVSEPDTAQAKLPSRFEIWGGVSVPLTGCEFPFGGIDVPAAKIGFALGLNYVHSLNSSFGWANQLSFSMNSFDKESYDKKLAMIQFLSGMQMTSSGTSWLSIWATTGVEVGKEFFPGVWIYADAMMGIVFARTPQVDVMNPEVDSPGPITTGESTSASVAFDFNLGALICKHFVIGVRYSEATVGFDLDPQGFAGGTFDKSYKYSTDIGLLQVNLGLTF